ncbi:hypothetical protein ACFL6U_01770 [Planctomycetota bacterium]
MKIKHLSGWMMAIAIVLSNLSLAVDIDFSAINGPLMGPGLYLKLTDPVTYSVSTKTVAAFRVSKPRPVV